MTKTTATPEEIAAKFVEVLREWLTPQQWRRMRALNRCETNPMICHSHDYCDANMAMLEARQAFGLDVPDNDNEAECEFWGRTWEAAMPALGRRVVRQ